MTFWGAFQKHPLHPAIVHFPLAFLLTVPLLQLWHMQYKDAFSAEAGLFLLQAGLTASIPAMLAGGWDFYRMISARGRQDIANTAIIHVMVILTGLLFYGAVLLLWNISDILALLMSLCGAATMAGGGFLGGLLVYRHGVGREDF